MTDNRNPEAVARGLTEAQREFLLQLPPHGTWVVSGEIIARFERNALRGFGNSGLIEGHYHNPGTRHRLTPLGIAVRNHIKGTQDDA